MPLNVAWSSRFFLKLLVFWFRCLTRKSDSTTMVASRPPGRNGRVAHVVMTAAWPCHRQEGGSSSTISFWSLLLSCCDSGRAICLRKALSEISTCDALLFISRLASKFPCCPR